ncbi:MAG: hypothetical protein WC807_11675 [Hyphomicrobium sp.]|jgi:hypothetical protein
MKTAIFAAIATLALASAALATENPACQGSSITTHGVWDCR